MPKILQIYELGEKMSNNKKSNLLRNLHENLNKYRTKHPKHVKYIVISLSGAVVLSLTVFMVQPVLNPKDTPEAQPIITMAEETEKSTHTYSTDQRSTQDPSRSGSVSTLNPLKGDIIKLGDKAPVVIVIQKKLTELDYMESDEPSEEFTEQIEYAVKLFQRKNEITITGQIDQETYQRLLADDAKHYTVSIGIEGTDVEQLQLRLYELGYINKVTSYFGTDTEAAVKVFQKKNGLYDDGNVGKLTREVLYSENAVPMSFSIGDESEDILKLQNRLNQLGYLTTSADGKYGKDTVTAVKKFQNKHGLIADGHIGPMTKEILMSSKAEEFALSMGDSGDDVTNIQKYLKKLNYLRNTTGYFGSDTHDAVINFQKKNGLTADGKVGSNTIRKLLSDDAKKWTGGSTSSGSGSSSGSSGSSSSSSSSSSSDSSSSGSSSGSSGSSSSSSGSSSNVSSSASVENLIAIAKSKLGSKYVYGAKGPNTFDCSGFVYWTLNKAGVKQSYMTSEGWKSTTRYKRISSMSSIKRGDVISFNGHVAIALGNGQMIDASPSAGKIRITSINSSYWRNNFVRAYRIF